MSVVRLEHGSGGALSRELVESVIHPILRTDAYPELLDSGPVEPGSDLLLTTDGYVVDPPFFPGGDIGRLSVFGTCNDLAVCGARPIALSLSLVIEEGFPLEDLRRALASAAGAAREAGARIVTGDTKVVPRGRGGGLYVTTAGVGRREHAHPLSPSLIRDGDAVIVSGPLGSHGLAVLAARERLAVAAGLRSDAAFLFPAVRLLFPLGGRLRFMRDATRGGIAALLNEAVNGSALGLEVDEEAFPVTDEVRVLSGLLGINPLETANEGVFAAFVSAEAEAEALHALSSHPLAASARCVGHASKKNPGSVILATRVGGRRILDLPRGLLLPRIC
jgi:hydrogenase expression/formation protein HypE